MKKNESVSQVPFKWRLRWFFQGFLGIFGPVISVEQRLKETEECVDEMIAKENQGQ